MSRPELLSDMHYLGVRIEEAVYAKLEKMAKPETVSTLVRRILSEAVNNKKK